jgi:hypothetical protein
MLPEAQNPRERKPHILHFAKRPCTRFALQLVKARDSNYIPVLSGKHRLRKKEDLTTRTNPAGCTHLVNLYDPVSCDQIP